MTKKSFRLVIGLDDLLLYSVAIYILYTFWFQYGCFEIPGLISILGVVIAIFSFVCMKNIKRYRTLLPILFFLAYLFCISIFNPVSLNYSILILKYMIPMIGIYTYACGDKEKLCNVLKVIGSSCLLLALAIIFKGQRGSQGGLELQNLNTNLASVFLIIGFISLLFFLDVTGKNKSKTVVVVLFTIIIAIGIVLCASRRGVLVMVLSIVYTAWIFIKLKNYSNHLNRIIILIIVLLSTCLIVFELRNVIMEMTVIQRFGGKNISGDFARTYYQMIAMDLFKSQPIFGNGLGAVEELAGAYSHSLYFELLACTGIIGIFIIVGYLVYLCVKLWKCSKTIKGIDINEQYRSSIVIWLVISIFISGIAVVFIYDTAFYIMIAVIAAYLNAEKNRLGVK